MPIKNGQIDFYLQLFVGGFMCCLGFFYVCLLIVVSNTYCVFVRFSSSCVSYVARFSAVFIFDWPSWFPNVYLFCVLCTLCCQVLRSVYSWLPLRGSLTFICPVYCVPYVARFSAVFIFDCPSWFPNVYLFCVLCTLCCQVLPSVYFWLAFVVP